MIECPKRMILFHPTQITLIQKWIQQGAKFDGTSTNQTLASLANDKRQAENAGAIHFRATYTCAGIWPGRPMAGCQRLWRNNHLERCRWKVAAPLFPECRKKFRR